jgi:hypothetical protein
VFDFHLCKVLLCDLEQVAVLLSPQAIQMFRILNEAIEAKEELLRNRRERQCLFVHVGSLQQFNE